MIDLRAIQSHLTFRREKVKCFAIILFALILVIIMNHRGFNLANTASATMCNPKSHTVQIIDESVTRQEIASVEAVNNPHFRSFITSVTEHVLSKFAGAMPCQENLDNKPMINLVFVRLPLVVSKDRPIAPAPSLNTSQSEVTSRLDSPWATLTIRRSASPQVRAVFIWNERQFLLDQALMSGARVSPTDPLVPIDDNIFGQYVQDYTDSVLLAPSPEARSAAQASIAKRLPAEILWLFRHAWQSTLAPFSTEVDHAMTATVERTAIGYTNLTKTLVDQLFASVKTEIGYKSILDLKNVFTIDQYRINQLH
jgi:hypothetical protein